jgi:SAM-dependent methyltransferase/uncharacterized protein YbaR (Trm112 family)
LVELDLMKRELIEILRCPYTGSPLRLAAAVRESASDVEYGIVTSEAGQFPIIGGILRLLPDRLLEPLVDLVRRQRLDDALRAALDVPFPSKWTRFVEPVLKAARLAEPGRQLCRVSPDRRRLYQLIAGDGATFSDAVEGAGPRGWSRWQSYRFSMPTFLPVYPLAHLARGRHTILDFGCGLGHSTFLMRRLVGPDSTIVAADYSFTSLCLAKRYLVPESPCICLDGDFPMPFGDGQFDLVFSTDAMQYIESKAAIARDFTRILSGDGVVALAHLHNRLAPSRTGKSLTPAGYACLFEGLERRLFPEQGVVSDYIRDGVLDLTLRHEAESLNGQLAGLSLVAARSDAPFVARKGLFDTYMDAMTHPTLNPVYRATSAGTSVTLERVMGEPFALTQRIDGLEVLPPTWQVNVPALDRQQVLTMREIDRPALLDLIRRFIVIETPDAFLA